MNSLFCLLLCLLPVEAICQQWSPQQLNLANTAKAIKGINDVEREAIQYLNLARLYPQQFARQEVKNAASTEPEGSQADYAGYTGTLMTDLEKMKPVPALTFDPAMYELAACFALESGTNGTTGHNRIDCKGGYLGECCSYGMNTGKSIALQWLVDAGISSLGHRKICLDGSYHAVGIAVYKHKTYRICAVADFK